VRRPFVIMLNQERHTRGAVFRRLVRTYAAQPPQPTPAAAAAR
jgi:hypothetical protein